VICSTKGDTTDFIRISGGNDRDDFPIASR